MKNLFIVLFPLLLSSSYKVPKPNVSIHYDKQTHSLWATNHEIAPYTLRVNFHKVKNARISCGNPCLVLIPPGQKVKVYSAKRKNRNKTWSHHYKYNLRLGDFKSKHDNNYAYRLPFRKTVRVLQGYMGNFSHKGKYALDFTAKKGTAILASRGGRVIQVIERFKKGGLETKFKPLANKVYVLHSDGSYARYLHLKYNGVKVKLGQKVKRGDLLGYVGSTGFSSRPHLHFEICINKMGESKTIPTLFATKKGIRQVKPKSKNYYAKYTEPKI